MPKLNAKNAWLVAKREYLERVRTRAFLIFTLLTPAILIAWAVVPTLLIRGGKQAERHLVVVGYQQSIADAVRDRILRASAGDQGGEAGQQQDDNKKALLSPPLQVETSADMSQAHRKALQEKLDAAALDGFLWLDQESLQQHRIEFVSRHRGELNLKFVDRLGASVGSAVESGQLQARGFSQAEVEELQTPYEVQAMEWSKGHLSKSDQTIQFFSVFILGLAMYMTVLLYGANVMRSVLAEKTSRIMEVLMSTLNPAELMAGKILGVGAVGLTQIAIWFLMGLLVSAPQSSMMAEQMRAAHLSASTGVYFAVFFVLGYFIYSAMSAALGAMVSSEQEAQQLNFFIMLPLILSFFYMFRAITSPTDPVVVALSFFPLSSPIIMYTRIVVQTPPAWQVALSIALLLAGMFAVIWVCARIYRTGILMYGKRPTLPEIIRWVRYA